MALAFVVYGGWAAFANHDHGLLVAARSFTVQGASSATTTLLMGGVIEALRARIGGGFLRGIAASVAATAAAACFHVSLHLLARTPEIARTVAPSVLVGFAFALTYSASFDVRFFGRSGRSANDASRSRDLDVERRVSSTLTPAELEEIWELYGKFVQRPKAPFLEAVRATDTVFIGRQKGSGRMRAFAAAQVVEVDVNGRRHGVLYNSWSGIDPAFRGGHLIQRAGLELFLEYRLRNPLRPTYFAMTSSTYKSYLLMTRNFEECWPHRGGPMPDQERAILDATVRRVGSAGWDAEAGLVRRHGKLRYTEGVVIDDGEQRDPDIAFYAQMNPLQHEGDSLACIAPLSMKNWMGMGLKALRRTWTRRSR